MAKKAKGLKTQERILKSAIHCLASLGYDKTTFQSIADHCGISQPLVVHYFKKKENVFPAVVDYLIARTREVTEKELNDTQDPTQRLRDYLKTSFDFFRLEPEIAKIFLTLSFLAAFDEYYRQRNSQIKQLAIHKITDILAAGIRERQFEISEVMLTAKMINSYLMGVLTDIITEPPLYRDEDLLRSLEKTCLEMVRYRGGE